MFDSIRNIFSKKKNAPAEKAKLLYSPREDDVYLVSYPKSGNTWVRHLIGNYLCEGKMDFVNGGDFMPDIHYNPEKIDAVPFKPRFIKSHFPYRENYGNVIYLVRDGRDVAVSLYYFLIKMRQLPLDMRFSDYLENYFFAGKSPFGHWNTHVFSWLKQPHAKNLLMIRYEDILDDPNGMMEKMVRFSGLEVDAEKIKIAVDSASFSSMQADEKKNAAHLQKLGHDSSHTNYGIVRSGKKGTWKEKFSDAEEQKFWNLYSDASLYLGYAR